VASAMIENFKSKIRQFLPRYCLFSLVSLGDFLRKKAFSRNPEITVYASVIVLEVLEHKMKNLQPTGCNSIETICL
jgi:hypothetical protein